MQLNVFHMLLFLITETSGYLHILKKYKHTGPSNIPSSSFNYKVAFPFRPKTEFICSFCFTQKHFFHMKEILSKQKTLKQY